MSKLFVNNTNIPISNFVITAYDKNGKELSPEDIEKTGVKFIFRKVNYVANDLAELKDDQSELERLQDENEYLRKVCGGLKTISDAQAEAFKTLRDGYEKAMINLRADNGQLQLEIEKLKEIQKRQESNK